MSSAGYNTCVLLSGHSLGRFLSSLAEGAVERSQSLGAFAHVQVLVRAYAGRDASKWLAIADPELLGCWQDPGGIRPLHMRLQLNADGPACQQPCGAESPRDLPGVGNG